MQREHYKSANYDPEKVTGWYVRRLSGEGLTMPYRVFEAASGTGRFRGLPGRGATLREYDTDGAELPVPLKALCDSSRQTELWGVA